MVQGWGLRACRSLWLFAPWPTLVAQPAARAPTRSPLLIMPPHALPSHCRALRPHTLQHGGSGTEELEAVRTALAAAQQNDLDTLRRAHASRMEFVYGGQVRVRVRMCICVLRRAHASRMAFVYLAGRCA